MATAVLKRNVPYNTCTVYICIYVMWHIVIMHSAISTW